VSVLMPPEPDDPILFHDERPQIDLDPAEPVVPEAVELPADFYRDLVHDSALAWVFAEPVLDESGMIAEWRGIRLNGTSPHQIGYPGLCPPPGTDAYRIPLLPEAIGQLETAFRRVWRDRVQLPVTFRATGGVRVSHYAGWAFPTGDGVGLLYRDVSDQAPQARDASTGEQLLPGVEEAADMGSFEWLVDADVMDLSPGAARLLGLHGVPLNLRLSAFLDGVEPGDRNRVESALRSAAQIGSAFRSRFEIPARGSVARRTIRQVGRPVVTGGRVRVIGVLEDITDTYQAELSFSRAQRLASLAMLSAGIAHDFNNILTVITMRADMVRESAAAEVGIDGFEEDARAILDAAGRASALTRQLMLFAGHQSGEPRRLDPVEVLDGMRPLLEHLGLDAVATEWHLTPTPPVLADRSQFEQVLLNLAVNARDAFEGLETRAPVLKISLGEVAATDPLVAGHDGADRHARWVALTVADNGCGMSGETLARACDPFFTTKERGRGTGLGLAVVFGILEQLGGWLDISSTEKVGTTVRAFIPPARPLPVVHTPAPSTEPEPEGALLVVVDDDPAVRLVTSRTLRHVGYRVLPASSGEECLRLLGEHPDVAAVVSDVVMPGMDGTELAHRILTGREDLPVLLVTGFSPPSVIGHPRLALVTKPLTSAQLTSALHRLLRINTDAIR
jgi:signal transduction histidine kinase/CheY-like chemotaxis protein